MSYAAILAQIKTDLESVTNIGNVHDSVRYSIYDDTYADLYESEISGQKQIRAWLITRENVSSQFGPASSALGTNVTIPSKQELVKHEISIDAFLGFSDNVSESEFNTVVDAVYDKFKDKATFTDTAFVRGPLNCSFDMIMFSKVLCHHAQITFYVLEFNNVTLV